MRRPDAWQRAAAAAVALLIGAASPALAQDGVLEHFNLDKLQINSLGGAIGHIRPSQVEPTTLFAVQADYGNIAPRCRVVFGASYWTSRYRDEVVQGFLDTLQQSLSDRSARVERSPITLYDVSFGVDVRYTPAPAGFFKPFAGVGIAAHVIDAEGKLINGTFVERSLDDIAAGLYATAGASMLVIPQLGFEASVRGDLVSGFRSAQVRAGAAYYFGQLRRPGGTTRGSSVPGRNGDRR